MFVRESNVKANFPIIAGLVLYSTTIFGESNSPPCTANSVVGMHAVTIYVREGMVMGGGTVKTGDRVDLLTTYSDACTKKMVTKFILQNVAVLAVNKAKIVFSRDGGDKTSMTLAVPPQQAELVFAADTAGALFVSVRSVDDESMEWTLQSHFILSVPWLQPAPLGDFWLPGEFERLLEERKLERQESTK